MKTKVIILVALLSVICTGCKKNNCIVRFYADGKPPVQSNVDVYNVDDLFKLYAIEYYDEGCDYSDVAEILSHNGDTVRVFGRFVDDWTNRYQWRLYDTSSSTISIGLSKYGNVDFTPNDTLIYIVTGKMEIMNMGSLMGMEKTVKANSRNNEDLKSTYISMIFIEARER